MDGLIFSTIRTKMIDEYQQEILLQQSGGNSPNRLLKTDD